MYQYERAVIRYNAGPTGFRPYDVSNVLVSNFQKYFSEVLIIVKDKIYDTVVAIKYSDYQAELNAFNGLIQEWLDTKASVALITYNDYPKANYVLATFHDIQYEWFTLHPGNANRSTADQTLININDAPDIRVHKTNNSNVDYAELNDHTLWLANHHFVRNVGDANDIYLLNAGKHHQVDNNTHVCCINFKGIGKVSTSKINKDDIRFTKDGSTKHLKVKCKEGTNNKTVWMVIGGRLYMNDIINVSDANAVWVNINKVDWFDKIFTSKHFIDLSNVIDPDVAAVSKDYFDTESFYVNLLTDPSSFFVFIDNPDLTVTHIPLREYSYPFTYHTERTEKLPLLLSNGLIPKYSQRKIINRRLLDIDAGVHNRYLFHTTGINNGGVYHEAVNLHNPSRYNRGYLLEIKALAK